jgi:hypothetical protein
MGQVIRGCVLDSNILIYHINNRLSSEAQEAFWAFLADLYISLLFPELRSWLGKATPMSPES